MNSDAKNGPRRSAVPQDIPQLAELLDLSFASALDASIRQMLHVVASMASLGGLAWSLACALGAVNREEWDHGVVWQEEGRIVANTTLTRRRPEPDSWLLSNVAVLPDFRRRGIARQLVQFAIEQVRGWGGRRILLQVDEENLSAANIYRNLGFREIGRRITWFHPTGILAENLQPKERVDFCRVSPRRGEDWPVEYRLLAEVTPAGLAWNIPLAPDRIRPSFWRALDRAVAGFTERHWLARCDGNVAASLMVTGRYAFWEGLLIQRDGTRGRVEIPLLRELLQRVAGGRQGVVDTTGEADPEAITSLGFRKRRALVWMQYDFAGARPGD